MGGCTNRQAVDLAGRVTVSGLARMAARVLCVIALSTPAAAQVRASYLYSLSNFDGMLPYSWGRLYADPARDETYFVTDRLVRIFNATGMEMFAFGDDLEIGQIMDLAVDDAGGIVLLSFKDGRHLVTRCNFRGEPTATLEVTGLPDGVSFSPNRMVLRGNRFYFASTSSGVVLVTDRTGAVQEHIALLSMLEEADRKPGTGEVELFGFTVDAEGNIYFTIPVMFKAFKLTAQRELQSFGRPGSAAGRFGVVAGIATDSRGNILVADRLRCVVMAFDRRFNFLAEFGYRGGSPQNLVVPDDLAVDRRDRVYVTQGRRRGVSVFALAGEP